MDVVVVESPTKAKTLRKYLGRDYRVVATRGHVRDLPAKAGSVKPDEDFAIVYKTGRRAARTLGTIRAALAEADALFLATDPDREGEAIAWQVLTWLQERDAVGDKPVHRIAFHEVTPAAVRAAMARPRALDMDLVRAQQARRTLDYLVGFGISPVLWRKLPGCRSAGRVQSVALRLVCEREARIEAFTPSEYWTVEVRVTAHGVTFAALPDRLDGAPLAARRFATRAAAEEGARRIREAAFTVASVRRRTVRRKPAAPFTTAMLQQEASRKLEIGVRRTMEIAQSLYEGVDLGGERAGLITYMRTDSVTLSRSAVREARRIVKRDLGERYLHPTARVFRSRARNVQEAHEAIRPTDLARSAESLAGVIDRDAATLYALVRNRTLASQMADARFDRMDVELASESGDIVLAARGSRLAFEGFLRVYREGSDEPKAGEEDLTLPDLEPGQTVPIDDIRVQRHVTTPPTRFTEAGLVRRLEELGIGRPSTFASIVSVLQERQYVAVAGGRFVPLERGRVVTAFLEGFFGPWVEYRFTADLEEDLDRVARGGVAWKGVLGGFWQGFHGALEAARALEYATVIAAVERALADFVYGPGDEAERRRCPVCREGELRVKLSRFGLFVACENWSGCGYRRSLAAAGGAEGYPGPKALGDDPVSGLAVTLRRGPHGYYVQRDDSNKDDSNKGDRTKDDRTKDDRTKDDRTKDDRTKDDRTKDDRTKDDRTKGDRTRGDRARGDRAKGDRARRAGARAGRPRRSSVPGGMAPEDITLDTALGLLALPREVGDHPGSDEPILAGLGRFGPWVRHGTTYAAIPDDDDVLTIGINRAVALLADKEIRLSRSRGPKRVLREVGSHPRDGAPVWLLCLARHRSHYLDCLTMSGTTGPRAMLNRDCRSVGGHVDPLTRHSPGGPTGC